MIRHNNAPGARQATNSNPSTPRSNNRPALSQREIEVLRTWFMCNSKSETASRLHIALGTLNTHLTRIRAKYHSVGRPAQTKAALVARAIQDGIIDLDDL